MSGEMLYFGASFPVPSCSAPWLAQLVTDEVYARFAQAAAVKVQEQQWQRAAKRST